MQNIEQLRKKIFFNEHIPPIYLDNQSTKSNNEVHNV